MNVHLERAFGVDALSIRVAASIVDQTLVYVSAVYSIAREAFVTSTLVRSRSVSTLGEFAAGVGVQHTLVVVRAIRSSFRFNRVALLASAVEGTDCIVTLPEATNPWLADTLIDVWLSIVRVIIYLVIT